MRVPKLIDNAIQYISGAMTRIFGPSDDAYPNTGVQPFDGEPSKREHTSKW